MNRQARELKAEICRRLNAEIDAFAQEKGLPRSEVLHLAKGYEKAPHPDSETASTTT